MRVLLAEGSLFNRRLATALLEKHGHDVVVASDGREVVDLFRSSQFDLIMLDAQLPGLDNPATVSSLRGQRESSEDGVPIILLGALGKQDPDAATGVDLYIDRPLSAARLSVALSRLTESSSGPIDWPAALEFVEGRRELLLELIQIFLGEYPEMLANIDQGIRSADARDVQVHAHGLKGCLRYFGETPAVELARQLERLGKNGELAEAERVSRELTSAIQQLLPSMQEFSAAKS